MRVRVRIRSADTARGTCWLYLREPDCNATAHVAPRNVAMTLPVKLRIKDVSCGMRLVTAAVLLALVSWGYVLHDSSASMPLVFEKRSAADAMRRSSRQGGPLPTNTQHQGSQDSLVIVPFSAYADAKGTVWVHIFVKRTAADETASDVERQIATAGQHVAVNPVNVNQNFKFTCNAGAETVDATLRELTSAAILECPFVSSASKNMLTVTMRFGKSTTTSPQVKVVPAFKKEASGFAVCLHGPISYDFNVDVLNSWCVLHSFRTCSSGR
eukprot:SAG31_NODE_2257_length_6072_cov_3.006864_1_plen_270_part_00